MKTDLERNQALRDISFTVNEWGQNIKIHYRKEGNITRGSLGSNIKETSTEISMKAFPINRNPDSKQLTKAGLVHKGSILLYTASYDWIKAGLIDIQHLEDIDITRITIGLDDREWTIAEVGFANRINDTPTYITFSLK